MLIQDCFTKNIFFIFTRSKL